MQQRRTGQQHQRLANMIRAGNHGWKKSMNRNFIFGQPKDNWPKPPSIINGGANIKPYHFMTVGGEVEKEEII